MQFAQQCRGTVEMKNCLLLKCPGSSLLPLWLPAIFPASPICFLCSFGLSAVRFSTATFPLIKSFFSISSTLHIFSCLTMAAVQPNLHPGLAFLQKYVIVTLGQCSTMTELALQHHSSGKENALNQWRRMGDYVYRN